MMVVLFLLLKFAVYAFWAKIGLSYLQSSTADSDRRAVIVALARIGYGVLLGLPMWFLATYLSEALPTPGSERLTTIVAYLIGYGALRWIAWSLVSPMVFTRKMSFRAVLVPVDAADLKWRVGGVILSFLMDLPGFVAYGGPYIGKVWC